MEVFQWDKETAFYYLKQEQELLTAGAWNKAGDTYKRWETASRAIKDASKVTVFVVGNTLTAGGMSAAVTVGQGASIVVGGASLVMEIGEDVNIAIGNEENAAILNQSLEDISPITDIFSIISLKDIGDPGNLFFLADKAGKLSELAGKGSVYLTVDDPGMLLVGKSKPKGLKILNTEKIEKIDSFSSVAEIASLLAQYKRPEGPSMEQEKGKETAALGKKPHKLAGKFVGLNKDYLKAEVSGGNFELTVLDDDQYRASVVGSSSGSAKVYFREHTTEGWSSWWLADEVDLNGKIKGTYMVLDGEIYFDILPQGLSCTGKLTGGNKLTGWLPHGYQAPGYSYDRALNWSAKVVE